MASDWHHHHWLWMTLNCPSLRSSKLHVKCLKNGDRYDIVVNKSRMGNHRWATIGNMTFDLEWPWTVLDLGHKAFSSDTVSRIWRQIQCWTQMRSDRNPPAGFRLALCALILNDLELAYFKVIKIARQILRNVWQMQWLCR